MNLGMSGAAFYGRMETEETAAYLTRFPIDCCEIFLQTGSEYTAAFGRLVREMLGGLNCVSVHAKGNQFEWDLFGRSPRQVEDAFSQFTGVCDAGQAMGARYYVFHGPAGVHAPLTPDRIHALPRVWGRMQEIAASRGLEVLWENVSWCALRRPEDARSLIALAPDIRFVLDVKQAKRSGTDPFGLLEAMGDRVAHIHALDWTEDGAWRLPGQGVLDWPRLIGQLRAQGYDGTVMLEPYASQAGDDAALTESLAYLRRVLQL
ncbi:MAG: sugar phosphate isomerase/epimerase family protein [Aristaeellaceae bacterium]